MNKAASDAVGCKINISQEHQGLDEVGKIRDEEPESNVSFTNTTSVNKITKEYKQRLQEHEEWRISERMSDNERFAFNVNRCW